MRDQQHSAGEKKRVIVVGHTALDEVYRVERFPTGPGKYRAIEHRSCGGGSAANAAVALARLGACAELWSRIGDDTTGLQARELLVGDGVNVQGVKAYSSVRTPQCAVLVDDTGERLVVGESDHAMPMSPEWLPIDHVYDAAAILSDLTWREATLSAFVAGRDRRVPTLIDVDIAVGEPGPDILELTDYAIFSARALERFVEGDDVKQRLMRAGQSGLRYVGVTVGDDGYYWVVRNQLPEYQPSFEVPAIDTTGAGDAFHGAFAWAITLGFDERECARIASAVAAMNCMGLGARSALPRLSALEAFLLEHDGVGLDVKALSS